MQGQLKETNNNPWRNPNFQSTPPPSIINNKAGNIQVGLVNIPRLFTSRGIMKGFCLFVFVFVFVFGLFCFVFCLFLFLFLFCFIFVLFCLFVLRIKVKSTTGIKNGKSFGYVAFGNSRLHQASVKCSSDLLSPHPMCAIAGS